MDHISTLLNAKRLPIDEILSSPVRVTLKIDGNALQWADGSWHKRAGSPRTPGKEMTLFDFAEQDFYWKAIRYLSKFKKLIEKFSIMNFEVFSDEGHHTIEYSHKFKNNIVLLSAYIDNRPVSYKQISEIASRLSVDVVPLIYKGKLTESMKTALKKGQSDYSSLFKAFYSKFFQTDFPENQIEGFVFTFDAPGKMRDYKLNNPEFVEKLHANLDNDSESKGNLHLEDIIDMFISAADKAKVVWHKSYFQTLLSLFSQIASGDLVNKVYNKFSEMSSGKPESIFGSYLNKDYIKSVDSEIADRLDDKKFAIVLRLFLLCFQKARKMPMGVSQDYQTEVLNPFIEHIQSMHSVDESYRFTLDDADMPEDDDSAVNTDINNMIRQAKEAQYTCKPYDSEDLARLIRKIIKKVANDWVHTTLIIPNNVSLTSENWVEAATIFRSLAEPLTVDLMCINVSELSDFSRLGEHFIHQVYTWNYSLNDSVGSGAECYIYSNIQWDISDWDMRSAKKLDCMFKGLENFNSDLSGWNVSNVEDMSGMFQDCLAFNKPLDDWGDRLKNVKTMESMFAGCRFFDQSLENWDVSNVEDFSNMFFHCHRFKGPLTKWIPYLKNAKTYGMFDSSAVDKRTVKMVNESYRHKAHSR